MVPAGGSAMDVLKMRYAKGEITVDQFREMSEEPKKIFFYLAFR